jgi:GNAT superfamily N-acetyltransferase
VTPETRIELRRIALPLPGLDALIAESLAQGFQFLTTLEREWQTGENRFSAPGEGLFGGFGGAELVAIGGLNRDPFLGDPAVGRIRRVYVRTASRRLGVGTQLVERLLDEGRQHFRSVRLRAVTPDAARLYETLGFRPIADPHATHILAF